ncbi:MAG: restriction endonuclease [Acetobacteraceae bacterium]|nr:restriction endonuclease [Acetobacteraceae bacterium]
MAVPTVEELVLPALTAMDAGVAKGVEIAEFTALRLALSKEDLGELQAGGRQTVFRNRVAWALVWLQKAGLVEKTGASAYALSPEGRRVMAAKPARFGLPELRRYEGFVNATKRASSAAAPAGVGVPMAEVEAVALQPADTIDAAVRVLDRELRDDLLRALVGLKSTSFEALVVDLLLALGFGGGRDAARGERLGMSGDGGVDGVMREDALGLDVVYIQAKKYGPENPVGPDAVQAFAGSLLERGATKGVFVTTSRFTGGAQKAAERLSTQRRIVLIDGEELARLMIESGVGVREVQTIRIHRVDLSAYEA